MKITAIIDSMQSGGAERMFSVLTREWKHAGHQVEIFTFKKSEYNSFYQESARGIGKLTRLPFLIAKIRGAIKRTQPDIVVSFMDQANILTLLATLRLSVPILVAERVYPAYSSLFTETKSTLLRKIFAALRNLCYRRAAAIVVQSDRSIGYFPPTLHRKIFVIPNAIIPPSDQGISVEIPTPTILTVGRLTPQKRFDLQIKAFQLLADEFPEWHLLIAGSGGEMESLQRLADAGNGAARIHFLGYQGNTAALFAQAAIFMLTSDYEGFPVVLGEALYCGVPVIATDCLTGPREILGESEYGKLIPTNDSAALTRELRTLMSSLNERARFSELGKSRALEFSPDKVFPFWQQLFDEITNKYSNLQA